MAEFLMKDLLKRAGIHHITVSSRGLHVFNPLPIASHVKTLLSQDHIDVSSHTSTMLVKDDFTKATLVLTMTHAHQEHIRSIFPEYSHQTYSLTEYVTGSPGDIQDPYGGNIHVYQECYFQLKKMLKKLITNLPT